MLRGYKYLYPNYPINSLNRVNSLVEASNINYYNKYYYQLIIIIKKVVITKKAIKIKIKKVKIEINTYYTIFTNLILNIKKYNSTINTFYNLIR